jgi:hypothetical protein
LDENPYKSPPQESSAHASSTLSGLDNVKAFFKGGLGCVTAFLVFGAVSVLLGGGMSLHAGPPIVLLDGKIKFNFAGAMVLFVFGGLVWLVISNRRRKSNSQQ